MNRALVSLTFVAMGLAAPLAAEPVYVPVVDAQGAGGRVLATQLWVTNFGGEDRPYSSVFLAADTDGTELSGRGSEATVPANKAAYLKEVASEGETGLLEIERAEDLEVSAWIKTVRGRRTSYTGVPVISEANRLAAGEATYLNGLADGGQREIASLALVNLSRETAQCQVDFLRADGSATGAGVAIEVAALSLRPFADALGLGSEPEAVSARVSCDQAFYAYALASDRATAEVAFVTPEPALATEPVRRIRNKAAATAQETIVFTQSGRFHYANKQRPKVTLRVPVPHPMSAARITAEFDFVAGPWNPRKKDGAHNLLFFHRGRFRSNTLANVNALGPNRNLIKINQNLDMAAGANTKAEAGYSFVHGQRYHVTVVQDAPSRVVTLTLSQNGQVLRTLRFPASVRSPYITIPATGLVAEFGNYDNQALPEVSSLAFAFENFRVEMISK